MSEYAEREAQDLEPYYIRHVAAMTAEGLHSKAAIAKELAYRDQRIADLERQLAWKQAEIDAMRPKPYVDDGLPRFYTITKCSQCGIWAEVISEYGCPERCGREARKPK